jgi:hypothetical protein
VANEIQPAHLLSQAKSLAGVGRGRGKPNHTNHRRAVSAAYYAAYHALAKGLAKQLLPSASAERQLQTTRAIEHASLASACRWIISTNAAGTRDRHPRATPAIAWRILTTRTGSSGRRKPVVPADAVRVARDFVTLYQARRQADYDHTAEFRKASVLSLIDRADQVVAVAQRPRQGAKQLEALFAVAALSSRMLRP